MIQMIGESYTPLTSTDALSSDASAAYTRMCPTCASARSVYHEPSKNPAYYAVVIPPLTSVGSCLSSARIPTSVLNTPAVTRRSERPMNNPQVARRMPLRVGFNLGNKRMTSVKQGCLRQRGLFIAEDCLLLHELASEVVAKKSHTKP